MKWWYILGFFFLLTGLILWLILILFGRKNKLVKEKNISKNPSIAIFIPARDESNVIEQLIISILNQTVKVLKKDIYIIVESMNDKTVKIAKKYHINIILRKDFTVKTKGYALKEAIEYTIQKKKYYDLYFIFDADNILDKNYIKEMLKIYYKGYAFAFGYRALKNKNNAIAVSSWLTFYLINEIQNENRKKQKGNLTFSGTGFYIHGDYIKKWQTYPFHSLTEDYELSLYLALEGISTYYTKKGIFYDEQPTKYHVSIIQRSRWIKGYFTNWLKYFPKLIKKIFAKNTKNRGTLLQFAFGVFPTIFLILGILILSFTLLSSLNISLNIFLIASCSFLFICYLILVLLTVFLLEKNKEVLNLKKSIFFLTIFYHPIYLISYVHSALYILVHPNLGWSKIEHKESLNNS